MRKTIFILATLSLLLSFLSLSALAVDVSGEWEMTTEGRQGPRTSTFKIEQDGEKITVTMEGMGMRGGGEEMKGEGTIKGNKIEWTITMSTERGDFTINYTGTVEGDTMTGERKMGDREGREFTAKKK